MRADPQHEGRCVAQFSTNDAAQKAMLAIMLDGGEFADFNKYIHRVFIPEDKLFYIGLASGRF